MARISDEELERLKAEVSIESLAKSRGVVLRKRGEELMGLCPFHEDHEPSLVINPEKNLWHCLGACQAGGSVVDWVMKAEGVSFRHAVELLRSAPFESSLRSPSGTRKTKPDSKSSLSSGTPKQSTVKKLGAVVDMDADTQEQLKQVIDFYHETLKQSPEALGYLEKRGIGNSEAIDRFKLGYANRTLGYRLPDKNRKAGAEVRGRLTEIGVYRKSGHEHFAGSLVIPVIDGNGVITEVYGRKINDNLRKGTPLHLYLPGPHRGIWNIESLQACGSAPFETAGNDAASSGARNKSRDPEAADDHSRRLEGHGKREIILCESLIDALTFWCAGYRNVTAAYGIEGFTPDHLEAFKTYGIERVLIAYDRDEPGERAASSLAAELMEQGLECFRIQFPKGMDANEYALSLKPAEKSLGLVIRKAIWMGKGERPDSAAAAPFETPQMDDGYLKNAAKKEEEETEPAILRSEASRRAREEEAEPAASPIPQGPPPALEAEQKDNEVTITLGDRRWRIRGLEKNLSVSIMKVNILVSSGEAFHVDTFDLYAARYRQGFIKQAADELSIKEDVIKRDLGKVLLKLEELQEQLINRTLNKDKEKPVIEVTGKDREAALELLQDPNLLDRILGDFEKCGIVGEETNKLIGYLAAVSRKLEEPLAIVIQSSSAAGKSSLMEAILSFFPREEQVKYSAMTGQSLFYMGEADLRHKILAIVEEEGAERAAYALKLLQSEGELTIASTGKDPTTGRLVTQEYRVEGPVMIFLTTTAIEIDEELQNRCIVLTVDEEREQTRAIHRLQRESQTLEGLLARQDRSNVLKVHQDAQRLLRPHLVANPFAKELTFLDDRTRTRRDHMKYLTLIRSIALLRQYQREVKYVQRRKSPRPPLSKGEKESSPLDQGGLGDFQTNGERIAYIEVTLEDIEVANRLAHQVLGRSLDELSPQSRRLLMQLDEMVSARCKELAMERADYRFTQREVRGRLGIGNTQLKVHLARLVELEYVLVHRGGRGQQFVYELAYDGQGKDGSSFVPRLLDVSKLKGCKYDENRSGQDSGWSGGGRPQVGPKSGGGRGADRPLLSIDSEEKEPINGKLPKIASRERDINSSYLCLRSGSEEPTIQAKGAE